MLPMAFESIAHVIPAMIPKTEKLNHLLPSLLIQESQLQISNSKIETLWKQLSYGQEQMTKLFQWLEAETLKALKAGTISRWIRLPVPLGSSQRKPLRRR